MLSAEKRTFLGGRITLWRGDSLELLSAGRLACDAIISDLPYGINYRRGAGGHSVTAIINRKPIHGDDAPFDPAPWLMHAGCDVDVSLGAGKPIVLWGADHFKTRLPVGGRFICWDKSCGAGAASTFSDAEFAWTNRRNARNIYRHLWMGIARKHDGSDISKQGRKHPSQKPVTLMQWCMEHSRVPTDAMVLDPYMGTGTTALACIRTGRRFVGVEIDAEYFEIACERVQHEIDKAALFLEGVSHAEPAD